MPDITARMEDIGARLENISRRKARAPVIVVGGEEIRIRTDHKLLAPARGKHLCLCKADERADRLAQLPLGLFGKEHHGLPAGRIAGVCDARGQGQAAFCRAVPGKRRRLNVKRRVGEPVPEGVGCLLRAEGLKIAVADVDILVVDISDRIPEILCRGIIRDIPRDRVREPPARGLLPGENIRHSEAPGLAALPDDHDG